MKTSKKIAALGIIVLVIILIVFRLSSNYAKINANKNVSTDLTFVSVNTENVVSLSLKDTLRLTGVIEANSEVDIASEAAGTITELNLQLGQSKSEGSVIGAIDSKLKKLAVQKAKIMKDKLDKDLGRNKTLFEGGSLTAQKLDESQTSYDDAVIQLQQAEKQLSDATIKSPISGIVTKKNVEKGEFVNIGTPLGTIVDISKLKIKLNVSEWNVYKIKVGDKALITTDIYPGIVFEGKISFVSPQGDASHNYPVEILIPNNSKHPLKSGTFANVQIALPEIGEGLYIPRESLIGSTSDAQVYVAVKDKAKLRNIVVKEANDKYLKVISGLAENELVIVNGQINLADDKTIKIIK
jgi:RND family efflux transporter MFP subunit